MSLTMRFATPDDAGVIYGLIVDLATYEREPDAVRVTPADLRAQLAAQPPPFECLIAEWNSEPAGFALFFQNYSTWRGRPGLYLEDLFVRPEHRARGIGRALLQRLAQIAVARRYARVEWSVLDWNTPAIAFYEKLGARPLSEWTMFRLTDEALRHLAAETTRPAPAKQSESARGPGHDA